MSPFLRTQASGLKRFHGGVKPSHAKGTKNLSVVEMPIPKQVIIPMGQHIGAPCVPIVKPGDQVKKGQVIGTSEAFVSAPIHASTSGKVKAVGPFVGATGARMTAVTIDCDGEDVWDETITPPTVTCRDEFIAAIQQSGLVGLGGAGFPTHVKLRAPKDHPFEILVINAAECEPYLTVDYRAMLDNTDNLLAGIAAVTKYLDISRVVIGTEDNKKDAVTKLLQALRSEAGDAINADVEIMALPSRYPQGAEKTLIYAATGRRVPVGGLPANVGCVVMNVTSVAFVGDYLRTGHPLVAKNITVDGDIIAHPQNIRAVIGTPIKDIVEFCGGLTGEPSKILMGGPMMGLAISSLDQPILKNNNGLLFFSERMVNNGPETDCIRCGRCSQHCPMNLLPKRIMDTVKFQKYAALSATGVMNCIECGSCAYECPAHIPLVQYMKLSKDFIKKGKR